MLSKEQRARTETYAFRNGMRNAVWLSGLADDVSAKDGYIIQRKNKNQRIRFVTEKGSAVPTWVKNGAPLKIVGRITGAMIPDPAGGQDKLRVALVKVLSFEAPTILEMPPLATYMSSVPEGVPKAEYAADAFNAEKFARSSDNSNVTEIAGFVSGFILRKGSVADENGKRVNTCLFLNVRQTLDDAESIPVRLYGEKVAREYFRHLKDGMPVSIRAAQLLVDVKATGQGQDENGYDRVSRAQYVKAMSIQVATHEQIKVQPQWAVEMARAGRLATETSQHRTDESHVASEPTRQVEEIDPLSVDDDDIKAMSAQLQALPTNSSNRHVMS